VVAPPNILPVANAGTNQTITAPTNAVNLNGTASMIRWKYYCYSWVLVSGQVQLPSVMGIQPVLPHLV
jgi:hypothetical protein